MSVAESHSMGHLEIHDEDVCCPVIKFAFCLFALSLCHFAMNDVPSQHSIHVSLHHGSVYSIDFFGSDSEDENLE